MRAWCLVHLCGLRLPVNPSAALDMCAFSCFYMEVSSTWMPRYARQLGSHRLEFLNLSTLDTGA